MIKFTVTNTNNSGAGSLRQAILDANALTGKDIINFGGLFNDGLAHAISLTGSGLSITDNLSIEGTNPSLLTIKDNSATRVFDIASGVTATINGLTITNTYNGAAGGGGISNEGVLTLSNSIITGNIVKNNVTIYGTNYGYGGGIYNTGSLTVNNSTISGNTADKDSNNYGNSAGGGIYNTGSLTVNNSNISHNNTNISDIQTNSGNLGGGIYSAGTITLNNSTITGNTAEVGGGIYSAGTVTVNSSMITDNIASDGGGIHYYNTENGLIYYGSGGGIFNTGNITVYHSTITDNTASDGGGIYNNIESGHLTLSVINSSISDNSASSSGGGIYYVDSYGIPLGTITLSNSTISGNSALKGSGGGIYDGLRGNGVYDKTGAIIDTGFPNFGPTTITVTNSIINDNSAGTDGGGIYSYSQQFPPNSVSSTISMSNSIISGNSAGADGGGIYSLGIITLTSSIINDNSVGADGGGIYNGGFTSPSYKDSDQVAYGNLTLIYSTISDNSASSGGGIYNNGTLSLNNSTISDNYARDYGGGIYNSSFNEFSILNPASFFNPAYTTTYKTLGIVTVSHSSIRDNTAGTAGGGIYNNPDQDFGKTVVFHLATTEDDPVTYDGLGIVNVSNSTISDNQAHFGGGIYNDATLTVANSTIRHNKAFGIELTSDSYQPGDGAGIYNKSSYYSTATVDYSTIACNFDTPKKDSIKVIKHDDVAGKFINKGHN